MKGRAVGLWLHVRGWGGGGGWEGRGGGGGDLAKPAANDSRLPLRRLLQTCPGRESQPQECRVCSDGQPTAGSHPKAAPWHRGRAAAPSIPGQPTEGGSALGLVRGKGSSCNMLPPCINRHGPSGVCHIQSTHPLAPRPGRDFVYPHVCVCVCVCVHECPSKDHESQAHLTVQSVSHLHVEGLLPGRTSVVPPQFSIGTSVPEREREREREREAWGEEGRGWRTCSCSTRQDDRMSMLAVSTVSPQRHSPRVYPMAGHNTDLPSGVSITPMA